MVASGTADPIGRSPKRRVLMLLGNNPYPRDQRVRAEAAALTQAGYAVSVICPGQGGDASRETIDGVAVYRYRERVGNASGVIGYAVEFLYATIAALGLSFRIRGGFDVIHAHNPPDTFVLVALAHRLRGKRFVFDHHDLAPDLYQALTGGKGNGLVLRVLAFFERRSLRAADRVIATNDSYKQVAIERGGVPAEKITVVRNGPDLDRIRPTAPDEELRSKAGTILAYAGEIGRHDGLDHLLRALDHLVSNLGRTDVLCLVIGEGDALDDGRRLARDLRLERHVLFTGFVSDPELLCRYLCTADICVEPVPSSPYTDRSTMIKIMDYMALARPVVAFDLPEHRITAGSAAVYARPNDDRALAESVAELIVDPERRSEMGMSGRRRIETELAWNHSVPPLLACYDQLFGAVA